MTPDFKALPIISLWQPWANWVALGWKTIETRTHNRFRNLAGKRIGIHCALKWDSEAMREAAPFLTDYQQRQTSSFLKIGGALIATAYVYESRRLISADAAAALIECDTLRYGLILRDIEVLRDAVPAKGRQGIWYLTEAK